MEDKSDYGRLERAIAMLRKDDEPPAGWEAHVLSAAEPEMAEISRRNKRLWLRQLLGR